MASIRQIERAKGTAFEILVSTKDNRSGKYCQKSTIYYPKEHGRKKIEQEVKAFAADFEKRVKEGSYYTGEKMTFEDAVKKWQIWAPERVTIGTIETYNGIIQKHLYPRFRFVKVSAITPIMCQDLIDDLKESGLCLGTITKIKNVLNAIMKYCYKQKIIQENPVDRIEMPKIKREDTIHFFTPDQVKSFFTWLDQPQVFTVHSYSRENNGVSYPVQDYETERKISYQWKVLFHLAIITGFRRGEIIGLTWKDINDQQNTIRINKAAASTRALGQIIKEPKTPKSNRTITVPIYTINALMQWKADMMNLCAELGTYWKGKPLKEFDDQSVFIQEDGQTMHISSVTHKFKQILRRYNAQAPEDQKLPDICLHDLRHTSASILLADGVDPETVSRRLGHANVSITLNRYGHAMPEKDTIAADVLAKNLLM